ncbi:hypothetical protein J2Z60_000688 [Lactobacillus colini]|uniref:Uncharacterized protein n=1 Tax=Lactobacillus colini TaxID=1819254 RepID=A0ABS4MCV3_9LACO|nr:hypothetical protein [Lactobacillus colini]MBP2057517.1 hypothetical protein [Lactobacillus colini]
MENEIIKLKEWLALHNNLLTDEDNELSEILKEDKADESLFTSILNKIKMPKANLEEILMSDSLSAKDKTEYLVYWSVANKDINDINRPILEGYLLFLSQEYLIQFSSIVAYILLKKYGKTDFLNQFSQFLKLNIDYDGSIGILNPLRESLKGDNITNWKFKNTYFGYMFLIAHNQ